MFNKEGMLTEDLKIQVGNEFYHNLDVYSPNWRSSESSNYGVAHFFKPDIFEYNNAGERIIAKFGPSIIGSIEKVKKRIKIPISQMREEVSELESELLKADENESNVTRVGEGKYQVNEPVKVIRRLIDQRKDFLKTYVDTSGTLEPRYA